MAQHTCAALLQASDSRLWPLSLTQVHNFPFPTPPDPDALRSAHRCLEALAALEPKSGALTAVGRAMAAFPISPRHARMLLEVGAGVCCLGTVCSLVWQS